MKYEYKGFDIKFNGNTYEYYSLEHDYGNWALSLEAAKFYIDEYLDELAKN